MSRVMALRLQIAGIVLNFLVSTGLIVFALLAAFAEQYDKATFCLLLGWLVHTTFSKDTP